MLRLLDRSRPDVAVPLALATELPGQREPYLRLGGLDFGSSQVLLDVDVGAPFRRVDVVVQPLGGQQRRMTTPHRLVPGQLIVIGHVMASSRATTAADTDSTAKSALSRLGRVPDTHRQLW